MSLLSFWRNILFSICLWNISFVFQSLCLFHCTVRLCWLNTVASFQITAIVFFPAWPCSHRSQASVWSPQQTSIFHRPSPWIGESVVLPAGLTSGLTTVLAENFGLIASNTKKSLKLEANKLQTQQHSHILFLASFLFPSLCWSSRFIDYEFPLIRTKKIQPTVAAWYILETADVESD